MNRSEEQPLLSAFEISTSSIHAAMGDGGVGKYASVTSSADTIPIGNLHPLKHRAPKGLTSQESIEEGNEQQQQANAAHHGTIRQTVLNIAKACAGTGTLALPYAASQGGYIFNIVGLVIMSSWNIYAVSTLCKCRNLIPAPSDAAGTSEKNGQDGDDQSTSNSVSSKQSNSSQRHRRTKSNMRKMFHVLINNRVDIDEHETETPDKQAEEPPEGTATYGRVAFYAFGSMGLHVLDAIMVVLLCGIAIAYEDALIGFIRDTPLTTGSAALDSIWTVLIIAPLSCVPDLSYLSKCSALGIFAIVVTFVVIFCYGVVENGLSGFGQISGGLWPKGFTGISNWFGILAFGFGVVPIAYNISESMEYPQKMPYATKIALYMVCGAYVVIGNGAAIVFKPSVSEFKGDVLQELPESWIPTMVRLAMTFVVVVTVPLLVVPCAELIEGKLGMTANSTLASRLSLRFIICLLCSVVAFSIPGFVHIISFIGAFCLGLTSFVFPPLMHIKLLKKKCQEEVNTDTDSSQMFSSLGEVERFRSDEEEKKKKRDMIIQVDTFLLISGVLATSFASLLTFSDMLYYVNCER